MIVGHRAGLGAALRVGVRLSALGLPTVDERLDGQPVVGGADHLLGAVHEARCRQTAFGDQRVVAVDQEPVGMAIEPELAAASSSTDVAQHVNVTRPPAPLLATMIFGTAVTMPHGTEA